MKTQLVLVLTFLNIISIFSQSPDWENIRNHVSLTPDLTDEYEIPYIQPHHNDGWEDGLYISRDGLHLYSTYLPADLISIVTYMAANPICPDISAYVQAPLLGVDTVTNPWGCKNFIHSDIIYANRTSVSENFEWQPSNLASPGTWEGAVCALQKTSGEVEMFVFAKSVNDEQDLYWITNTTHNPTASEIKMPDNVNTSDFSEDNPHIERISNTELVLMLDNHPDGHQETDMYYCTSNDNGVTWTQKQPLTSVNTPYEDIHPHLWSDGNDWWLYYVSTDTLQENKPLAIFRSKQTILNDFNSWGEREKVIGTGEVTDGSGIVVGLGEPTLTTWGDISFVCVIASTDQSDETDRFEIDPWYMKRKNPISAISKLKQNEKGILQVFPNPVADVLKIKIPDQNSLYHIRIYNSRGALVYNANKKVSNSFLVNTKTFPSGLYLIRAYNKNAESFSRFVKK